MSSHAKALKEKTLSRDNFLQILISPRTRTFPVRFRLTILVFCLIVIFSMIVTFIYISFQTDELCTSTPVPLAEFDKSEEKDCEALYIRKDGDAAVPIGGGEIADARGTLELEITDVKAFEYAQIQLPGEAFITFQNVTNEHLSFLESNPTTVVDIVELITVQFPELFPWVISVTYSFTAGLVDDIFDGINFNDEDVQPDKFGKGPRRLQNATTAKYLILTYVTPQGANCIVQAQLTPELNQAYHSGVCTYQNNGKEISKVQFSNIKDFDVLTGILIIVTQLSGDFDQSSQSIPGFIVPELVLREALQTSFGHCCSIDRLSFIETFGLVSGFGFAVEGVITFLVAVTLCRGVLGLDKTEQTIGTTESLRSEYSVNDEIVQSDDVGSEKEEYGFIKNGVNYHNSNPRSISSSDLKRVVFNPRCDAVPYAASISISSFVVLMACSLMVAQLLKTNNTTGVCQATVFSEISKSNAICGPVLDDEFAFLDTESPAGLAELTISFNINAEGFDPEAVRIDSDIVEDIETECDGASGNGTTCLSFSGSPFTEEFLTIVDHPDGSRDISASYSLGDDVDDDEIGTNGVEVLYKEILIPGALNYTTIIEIDVTIKVLRSSETNALIEDTVVASLKISSEFRFSKFVTSSHSGAIIYSLLDHIADESFFEELLSSRFARCCVADSLNYFEYLGLMIGYLVLLEGVITFLVAMAMYYCLLQTEFSRPVLRFCARFLPGVAAIAVLAAGLMIHTSNQRDSLNEAMRVSVLGE